jgi:glycosyltransferase involved in cell wall biosynthesis
MKKVIVLHAQVPFVRGGAELLVEGLVDAINRELPNVQAELVQIPFKWYPEEQILSDMMAWRLLDLTESNGEKIDLVIGTKFPTYALEHPNKVVWLVHQHRFFYDLEHSEHDKLVLSAKDLSVRNKVRASDKTFISEGKGTFSIARTVSERLKKFNHLDSEPVSPPSLMSEKIYSGDYGDYIVCIARLNSMKRQDLLISSLAKSKKAKIVIIGTGDKNYLDELNEIVRKNKLEDRCKILGYVDDEILLGYLANCRAVYYGPVDEDYGYATIEGFLAKKPVITCNDSGEVTRFVEETGSGWVVDANPESIGNILDIVSEELVEKLKKMSLPGYELAKQVTWKNVLNKIVVPYL